MLALGDALALGLALLVLSLSVGAGVGLWGALSLPLWILLAKLNGLYDRDQRVLRHLTVDEFPSIVVWAITATAALAFMLLLTPAGELTLTHAFRVWISAVVAALALRGLMRFVWRRITPPERILLLGYGPLLEATQRKLELFSDIHGRVVGRLRSIGDVREVPTVLEEADRIIIAAPRLDEEMIAEVLQLCRRTEVKLTVAPPIRGLLGTAVHLEHVADLPLVGFNTWDVSRSTLLLKRALDLAASILLLPLAAPLAVLIAFAVYVDGGRPILFTHERAGLRGHPFRIYKFRTMVADAEARLHDLVGVDALDPPMFKLRGDPRVTRVGRLLRRTSLDELPQLFNVLRGDMSLVGPRPEQLDLVERYAPEHRFRLKVKPGLTGPMQVFGRGELTFEERLAVERDYIENLSLRRDLRILALTLTPLISGRGAF